MKKILKFINKVSFGKTINFLYFLLKINSKIKVRTVLKNKCVVKLEIGSGKKKGSGDWLTLDINHVSDLCWDLRNGIPFPNASVSMIYSSHLFEHLTYKEISKLLSECHRVLIPDGVFSICVPDARKYIIAYIKNDDSFWNSQSSFYEPANNIISRIDYVNYIAYMGGVHKYMFDEENLVGILKTSGFRNVCLRDFNQDVDMIERAGESIYAECLK